MPPTPRTRSTRYLSASTSPSRTPAATLETPCVKLNPSGAGASHARAQPPHSRPFHAPWGGLFKGLHSAWPGALGRRLVGRRAAEAGGVSRGREVERGPLIASPRPIVTGVFECALLGRLANDETTGILGGEKRRDSRPTGPTVSISRGRRST